MTKEKRLKTLQNLGIVTLILVSLFYINELFGTQLEIFRTAVNAIVLPFGIALFLSYLLAPFIQLLEKHAKIKKRIFSVLIVLFAALLVILLFLYFVGVIIYDQGVSFYENDLDNIVAWFNNLLSNNPEIEDAYNTVDK